MLLDCKLTFAQTGFPSRDKPCSSWIWVQEYISWEATFFTDGLHFNMDGQQAVLKLLLELIASKLPHLTYVNSTNWLLRPAVHQSDCIDIIKAVFLHAACLR